MQDQKDRDSEERKRAVEREQAVAREQARQIDEAANVAGVFKLSIIAGIFGTFFSEAGRLFLDTIGHFILFPSVAFTDLIIALMSWRKAWVQKSVGNIARALKDTVVFGIVLVAILLAFGAISILSLTGPILFVVALSVKTIASLLEVFNHLWSALTGPRAERRQHLGQALVHALKAATMALLTVATLLVFVYALPIWATIAMVGAAIGIAVGVYKAGEAILKARAKGQDVEMAATPVTDEGHRVQREQHALLLHPSEADANYRHGLMQAYADNMADYAADFESATPANRPLFTRTMVYRELAECERRLSQTDNIRSRGQLDPIERARRGMRREQLLEAMGTVQLMAEAAHQLAAAGTQVPSDLRLQIFRVLDAAEDRVNTLAEQETDYLTRLSGAGNPTTDMMKDDANAMLHWSNAMSGKIRHTRTNIVRALDIQADRYAQRANQALAALNNATTDIPNLPPYIRGVLPVTVNENGVVLTIGDFQNQYSALRPPVGVNLSQPELEAVKIFQQRVQDARTAAEELRDSGAEEECQNARDALQARDPTLSESLRLRTRYHPKTKPTTGARLRDFAQTVLIGKYGLANIAYFVLGLGVLPYVKRATSRLFSWASEGFANSQGGASVGWGLALAVASLLHGLAWVVTMPAELGYWAFAGLAKYPTEAALGLGYVLLAVAGGFFLAGITGLTFGLPLVLGAVFAAGAVIWEGYKKYNARQQLTDFLILAPKKRLLLEEANATTVKTKAEQLGTILEELHVHFEKHTTIPYQQYRDELRDLQNRASDIETELAARPDGPEAEQLKAELRGMVTGINKITADLNAGIEAIQRYQAENPGAAPSFAWTIAKWLVAGVILGGLAAAIFFTGGLAIPALALAGFALIPSFTIPVAAGLAAAGVAGGCFMTAGAIAAKAVFHSRINADLRINYSNNQRVLEAQDMNLEPADAVNVAAGPEPMLPTLDQIAHDALQAGAGPVMLREGKEEKDNKEKKRNLSPRMLAEQAQQEAKEKEREFKVKEDDEFSAEELEFMASEEKGGVPKLPSSTPRMPESSSSSAMRSSSSFSSSSAMLSSSSSSRWSPSSSTISARTTVLEDRKSRGLGRFTLSSAEISHAMALIAGEEKQGSGKAKRAEDLQAMAAQVDKDRGDIAHAVATLNTTLLQELVIREQKAGKAVTPEKPDLKEAIYSAEELAQAKAQVLARLKEGRDKLRATRAQQSIVKTDEQLEMDAARDVLKSKELAQIVYHKRGQEKFAAARAKEFEIRTLEKPNTSIPLVTVDEIVRQQLQFWALLEPKFTVIDGNVAIAQRAAKNYLEAHSRNAADLPAALSMQQMQKMEAADIQSKLEYLQGLERLCAVMDVHKDRDDGRLRQDFMQRMNEIAIKAQGIGKSLEELYGAAYIGTLTPEAADSLQQAKAIAGRLQQFRQDFTFEDLEQLAPSMATELLQSARDLNPKLADAKDENALKAAAVTLVESIPAGMQELVKRQSPMQQLYHDILHSLKGRLNPEKAGEPAEFKTIRGLLAQPKLSVADRQKLGQLSNKLLTDSIKKEQEAGIRSSIVDPPREVAKALNLLEMVNSFRELDRELTKHRAEGGPVDLRHQRVLAFLKHGKAVKSNIRAGYSFEYEKSVDKILTHWQQLHQRDLTAAITATHNQIQTDRSLTSAQKKEKARDAAWLLVDLYETDPDFFEAQSQITQPASAFRNSLNRQAELVISVDGPLHANVQAYLAGRGDKRDRVRLSESTEVRAFLQQRKEIRNEILDRARAQAKNRVSAEPRQLEELVAKERDLDLQAHVKALKQQVAALTPKEAPEEKGEEKRGVQRDDGNLAREVVRMAAEVAAPEEDKVEAKRRAMDDSGFPPRMQPVPTERLLTKQSRDNEVRATEVPVGQPPIDSKGKAKRNVARVGPKPGTVVPPAAAVISEDPIDGMIKSLGVALVDPSGAGVDGLIEEAEELHRQGDEDDPKVKALGAAIDSLKFSYHAEQRRRALAAAATQQDTQIGSQVSRSPVSSSSASSSSMSGGADSSTEPRTSTSATGLSSSNPAGGSSDESEESDAKKEKSFFGGLARPFSQRQQPTVFVNQYSKETQPVKFARAELGAIHQIFTGAATKIARGEISPEHVGAVKAHCKNIEGVQLPNVQPPRDEKEKETPEQAKKRKGGEAALQAQMLSNAAASLQKLNEEDARHSTQPKPSPDLLEWVSEQMQRVVEDTTNLKRMLLNPDGSKRTGKGAPLVAVSFSMLGVIQPLFLEKGLELLKLEADAIANKAKALKNPMPTMPQDIAGANLRHQEMVVASGRLEQALTRLTQMRDHITLGTEDPISKELASLIARVQQGLKEVQDAQYKLYREITKVERAAALPAGPPPAAPGQASMFHHNQTGPAEQQLPQSALAGPPQPAAGVEQVAGQQENAGDDENPPLPPPPGDPGPQGSQGPGPNG